MPLGGGRRRRKRAEQSSSLPCRELVSGLVIMAVYWSRKYFIPRVLFQFKYTTALQLRYSIHSAMKFIPNLLYERAGSLSSHVVAL